MNSSGNRASAKSWRRSTRVAVAAVALSGVIVAACSACSGTRTGGGAGSAAVNAGGSGRGFPESAPWVSFYGSAGDGNDLAKIASTYRVINIDADPGDGGGNFTDAEIAVLKADGRNRVISYLNLGSCEKTRTYFTSAPGFVACGENRAAQRGTYEGYDDEIWMDVGNADYQRLIVEFVAKRLAARDVDGFFLDNLEILEHGTDTTNGPCDAKCVQGGLDLVRKLREAFPNHLIVMQNATGDTTRLGVTGGVPFPSLLDGISHEDIYSEGGADDAEEELSAWRGMNLRPGGRPFWIATEDYVGSCTNTSVAKAIFDKSRARGFSPYVTDASGQQRKVCFWQL